MANSNPLCCVLPAFIPINSSSEVLLETNKFFISKRNNDKLNCNLFFKAEPRVPISKFQPISGFKLVFICPFGNNVSFKAIGEKPWR